MAATASPAESLAALPALSPPVAESGRSCDTAARRAGPRQPAQAGGASSAG